MSFRDRLGRVTQYTWDANRQLTSETDPLNRAILYEWCTCGQMVKLTDPKGNVTQWHHDLQGRVTQKQFADGTAILSSYGAARGLLSSVTDPKGQIKSFAYDKDNSLLGVSYSNAAVATPPVTWQWDAAYPRITTMQDGIGQTLYSYVAAGQAGAGRLASVDGPFSSDTITFSYDDLGRAKSRSVNGSANAMSSTFDALGRLSSTTTGLGQFTYSYDSTRGLLQTVNFPNGETADYTYYGVNGDLRLNTLQRKLGTTEIFFEKYTYTENGDLLTRLKRSLGVPDQTLSYSYDSADQLLSVSNPKDASNYPQSYAYDPAGNLTAATTPPGSRSFTYNSLNERTTDAGVAQQFDANGNLSSGMGFTLAWDAEDRVKSVSYNGTQKRIEYDYDGQGRRVRIRSMDNGVKTAEYLYVWDGLRLCEKRDSAVESFPVAIYYPQGERKFLSGTYINYFYLRDRLGSVRGATSDTGSIIQNSDYLPYGPPSPQQPAATDPDFGFTGHLKCPFTGLTLAPYRVLGYANWLSRDPIGEAGGINLYTYVANNPVNLTDPNGQCPLLITGIDYAPMLERLGRDWTQFSSWFGSAFGFDPSTIMGPEFAGIAALGSLSRTGKVLKWADPAAKGISTPYGAAFQSTTAEAQAALRQVQSGATVYKGGVLGRSETSASQFLSLENPLNSGYAGRYGIPPQNSNFEFILSGRVQSGAPVVTRPAPGIPPNPGGGIEAVTNPGSLRIDSFYMPD